jgi:triacylglycerol lipase
MATSPMSRSSVVFLVPAFTLFGSAIALWIFAHPRYAIILVCSPIVFLAMALALEYAANRLINSSPGEAGVSFLARAPSFAREFWLNIQVFAWQQPFRSACMPDTAVLNGGETAGANRPCVILVHGLGCNRGLWNTWLQRCADERILVMAPNLSRNFSSIDGYITSIDAAIRNAEDAGFARPVVVAHSMGGLVVRSWANKPGNAVRLDHLITIGTPHQGAWLATLGVSQIARDMSPGGTWIENCDRSKNALERERITCFYSDCDNLVFPTKLAKLPGTNNVLLRGQGHLQLLDHPTIWAEVVRRVTNRATLGQNRSLQPDGAGGSSQPKAECPDPG